MSNAAPITPAFVEAFVLECKASGMSKEATTKLLQVTMLKVACETPAFAEGFSNRLAVEGMDKSAWAMAGKLLTGGLAAGAAGLGAHAAYKHLNPSTPGLTTDMPVPAAPYSAGGGVYDATKAKADEQSFLADRSQGVAGINEKASVDSKRQAELQAVVDSNGPGAAAAIGELQTLRKSPFVAQRDAYSKDLSKYTTNTARQLQESQSQLKDLNASRGSWWNKTRNFLGFPKDFDAEERALVSRSGQLSSQNRAAETLQRRLKGGYVGGDIPAEEQNKTLQERFFPTAP